MEMQRHGLIEIAVVSMTTLHIISKELFSDWPQQQLESSGDSTAIRDEWPWALLPGESLRGPLLATRGWCLAGQVCGSREDKPVAEDCVIAM